MNVDSLEWRQARQWLISSGVIPATHRVTKPDVDLVDFARSLRDGVFLCCLLNTLKPDCIRDWTPKPLMQHSYIRNISVFLQACQSKFHIKESDLFTESDLYDVDNFKKVMHLLSRLSHHPEALRLGWVPFPREETREYYNQATNDDIYASLHDMAMTSERLYANMEDLYAEVPRDEDPYGYGDETIYDSICYYQAPPVRDTDADEKKKYVLKEICETERSFVLALKLICEEFYQAVHDHLSLEDSDLLFAIARGLQPVHQTLLEGFEKCVESKSGNTDITKYFLDSQQGLLMYGLYAARLPMAVEKAKQLQARGDTSRLLHVCQQRSQQRFPLSDLLSVPIQRFLKYPLLIKELHKCAKKCSNPSKSEVDNLCSVMAILEDIARYINATKGDFEAIQGIEEVQQSLVDYRGQPLLQCGRYHLDGELRFRAMEPGGQPKSNNRWAFLFDKVMMVCKKVTIRLGINVRYSPKHIFQVPDLRVETIDSSHRGKQFSFGFRLVVQGQGEYLAYAKTEELKSQWIDAINHAKEMACPREGKRGHHSFELHTFEKPFYCDACSKLLYGCYFQGYLCSGPSGCKRAAHRECLKDVEPHPPQMPPVQRRPLGATLSTGSHTDVEPRSPGLTRIGRNSGINGHENKRGQVFVAKQRYEAIGSRSNRVLSFDRGEELEVLNASGGSEWWEAISLRTGNRGEVPASFLSRKVSMDDRDPMEERLRVYSWYVGKKSRIEAEQALHYMRDGVFLIRESDVRPGEYAIALKWNKMPKHIKISKHPDSRKFYVSDVCEFLSVEELVTYYQHNSLGSSFPGVDTALRFPYKDVADGGAGIDRSRPRSSYNPPPSLPPPSLPPPPIPQVTASPLQPMWADVLFTFTAEFSGELTIEKHDRVRIIEKDTNKLGWWLGECNGRSGLFPSNYVREITT